MSISNKGYTYIATQEKCPGNYHLLHRAGGYPSNVTYLDEAILSATSLRKVEPDAHITLITDRQFSGAPFNDVVVISAENNDWSDGLYYKIKNIYNNSKFFYNCFVDTDIYFFENCTHVFSLLEHFDMCVAASPIDRRQVIIDGLSLAAYQLYNTGVIYFRKSSITDDFFKKWIELYEAEQKIRKPGNDQVFFAKAVLMSGIRVCVLSNEYNARAHYYLNLIGTVKVLHARYPNYEYIRKRINSSSDQRGWDPIRMRCVKANSGVTSTQWWQDKKSTVYFLMISWIPRRLKRFARKIIISI